MFWLYAGGNIILASFVLGSTYSESLGFIPAVIMTIVGNLAAYTICAWSAQKNVKYGIDEIVSHRPAFGYYGSVFGVFLILAITIGWTGILSSLMGSAGELSVTILTGSSGFAGEYYAYAIVGGIIIPIILLLIDPKIGFKLSNITVPIMLAFSIYMLIKLLSAENLAALISFKATRETSWIFAFEAIFAYAVVWLQYIGSWNRMAKTERGGVWGTYIGLALAGMLLGIVGGMATILTGEVDPTLWMLELNLSVMAFICIIAGTITTITILIYSGAMSLLTVFPNLNFRIVTVLIALPALPFIFIGSLREAFDFILIFGAMLAGPYWAIILIDYFLLRKQKINVKACFDKEGPYKYFKGFNPVAIFSQIVGMIVWLFLGGWMTGFTFITSSIGMTLFNTLGATLPAIIVSALVYYGLTKLFLKKYSFGDYRYSKKNLGGVLNEIK
ncbi:cytosine permease [Bacillus sp. Sa1BUA2]|uniref:Cytosine permease n=2 Tax=Bacillus norwichensis TaxID=2762217 RepID=A0ABR8VKU4_9BACI|nr:cytosine permease [Bacillus norwichensis]